MVTFHTFALLYLSTGTLSQPVPDLNNESSMSQTNTMASQPITESTIQSSKCENTILPTSPVNTSTSPSLSTTDNIKQSGVESCITTVAQAITSMTASVQMNAADTISLPSGIQSGTAIPLHESSNGTTSSINPDTKTHTDCSNEKPLEHHNQMIPSSTPMQPTDISSHTITDSASATSNLPESALSSPSKMTTMSVASPLTRNLIQRSVMPQTVNATTTTAIPCSSSIPHPLQQTEKSNDTPSSLGTSSEILSLSQSSITPTIIDNSNAKSLLPQTADTTVAPPLSGNVIETPSLPLMFNKTLVSPPYLNSTSASLPNTMNTTTTQIHGCTGAIANNFEMPTTPAISTVTSPSLQTINDSKAFSSPHYTDDASSSLQAQVTTSVPSTNSKVVNSTQQTIDALAISSSTAYLTEVSPSIQSNNTTMSSSTRESYSRSISPAPLPNATVNASVPNCLHETPSSSSTTTITPIPYTPGITPNLHPLGQTTVTTIVSPISNSAPQTALPIYNSMITTMPPSQKNPSTPNIPNITVETVSPPKPVSNTAPPTITDSLTSSSLLPAENTLNTPCHLKISTLTLLEPQAVDAVTVPGSTETPTISPNSNPTNMRSVFETLTPIQLAAAETAKSFAYARLFRPSRAISAIKYHIPPPKLYVPSLHSTLLGLHQPQR